MSQPTETSGARRTVRIGTRGSPLARWQAEHVAALLRAAHPELVVRLVEIRTQGDRDRNSPLAAIGGTGVFTKEIQRALRDGSVDLAVHSLKDLPTQGPTELRLAAVPPRESIADALVAPQYGSLVALPAGARVGTGSLRRRAQLRHARPGIEVVDLRGNVETRLRRALDGVLDAVVLAEAGLRRLGLEAHISERLIPPEFLPAVGQGALGIECRSGDVFIQELLMALDDPPTHRAVTAERALLAALGGGCVVPLGAWARVEVDGLKLDAAVSDLEGRTRLVASVGPSDDPIALGHLGADALRRQGADALLAAFRVAEPPR
jgi:hydroxymethylbilane synthase